MGIMHLIWGKEAPWTPSCWILEPERGGLGPEHMKTDRPFWVWEGGGRAIRKWNGFSFPLASPSLPLSRPCYPRQAQPVLRTWASGGAPESEAEQPPGGWGWGNSRGSWEGRGTAADTPVWGTCSFVGQVVIRWELPVLHR